MIRVTKHDILWFDGRRRRTMRPGDVFEADRALEARWVAEGVAAYVDGDAPAPDEAGAATEAAPDLSEMTRAELAEVAEGLGISVGRKTKAQLVAAIEGAEAAPDLSAAEVE